jgi:hypothetical protein
VHRRAVYSSLFLAFLVVMLARAQEGHPLTGTWSGDWGQEGARRTAITLVMNWDGKNVTGIINPGPDSIPIASVYVDYANWTLRIEADAKDSTGKEVHISAEGKLDDLGSYHRTIKGVWEQGKVKGEFRLTRD